MWTMNGGQDQCYWRHKLYSNFLSNMYDNSYFQHITPPEDKRILCPLSLRSCSWTARALESIAVFLPWELVLVSVWAPKPPPAPIADPSTPKPSTTAESSSDKEQCVLCDFDIWFIKVKHINISLRKVGPSKTRHVAVKCHSTGEIIMPHAPDRTCGLHAHTGMLQSSQRFSRLMYYSARELGGVVNYWQYSTTQG